VAKGGDPRKDARKRRAQRARDNYRKEVERRRAERMQGKGLKVPPFNAEEFIRLERVRSKAMLITIAYAAFIAIAIVGIGEVVEAPPFFAFIGLLLIGSLYTFLKRVFDIDMTKLGRWSSAAGLWFAFFITFMMVAFIMSNPPFLDKAPPLVECCTYFVPTNNTSQPWEQVNALNVSASAGHVRIVAHVVDNHRVAAVSIQYWNPNGNQSAAHAMVQGQGHDWVFELDTLDLNDYTIFVQATDDAGLTSATTTSMRVV
jgi:hypothetical protein